MIFQNSLPFSYCFVHVKHRMVRFQKKPQIKTKLTKNLGLHLQAYKPPSTVIKPWRECVEEDCSEAFDDVGFHAWCVDQA